MNIEDDYPHIYNVWGFSHGLGPSPISDAWKMSGFPGRKASLCIICKIMIVRPA